MKQIIILLFLLFSTLLAQIDTSVYYPLHIGDYWEYVDIYSGDIHSISVTGDTLMQNGKQYFVLNYFESAEYFRVEDNKYVFRFYRENCTESEYLYYNFSIPDSAIWPVCIHFPSVGESYLGISATDTEYFSIFKQLLETKVYEPVKVFESDTCWNHGCTVFFKDYVSKGVGLTRVQAEMGGDNFLGGAIINGKKYGNITPVEDKDNHLAPTEFNINTFPNPFNSSTTITVNLPHNKGLLKINVYDMLGREIRKIYNGEINKGILRFVLDAKDLSSGTYIITAGFNNHFLSQKILYLK